MPVRPRSVIRRSRSRLRSQIGLTLVESLVAATLLLVGVLATFMTVDRATSASSGARAREGATNLAREVLEDARNTQYTQIGGSGWFTTPLQGLDGGTGTVTAPNSYTQQRNVNRRGFTYGVSVTTCSVDDIRDNYGAHSVSTHWCSDSSSTGTTDTQPEDMKRVSTTITWSANGQAQSLTQTATFGSTGAAIGPNVTNLIITQPTGLPATNPVITSNPTGGIVTFQGTASGAADMKFSVNGEEVATGVTSAGNGNWNFNWNITSLKDGTYTIAATAIDILGTRGQPRVMQVTLNRGTPSPIQNVTGGYNYVKVSGTRTLVVELDWDASPDGTVTGYEVDRGATVVCGNSSSLATSCIDLGAPSSGSTTYTIKTWYRAANGSLQFISTTYAVTAPTTTTWPQNWAIGTSTANIGTNCLGTTSPVANTLQTDMVSTFPSGTTSTVYPTTTGTAAYVWGCLPPFPTSGYTLNAGNATATFWFKNPSGSCSIFWYVMLGQSTFLAGTATQTPIALSTGDTVPKTYTSSHATTPTTFAAGQQLAFYFGVRNSPQSGNKGTCQNDFLYYGSTTNQVTLSLPISPPAGSGSSLSQPAVPTGLAIVHNADGTNTLTWNAATGTPAPEFYRIYRDGQNYTNRYDTAGDTGSATISWTDTNVGGTTHTYYVTTASSVLTESNTMAGPVS